LAALAVLLAIASASPWLAVSPVVRGVHRRVDSHDRVGDSGQVVTWGRAAILLLMDACVTRRRAQEPREDPNGVSHLEIQKLMYFADIVEPRLELRFAPGRYGSYSDLLRHQLQEMEGAYLDGLGDGSALALNPDPLTPLPGAVEAAATYKGPGGPIEETIVEPVMRIIEGFEAPYGVELLASTHTWSLIMRTLATLTRRRRQSGTGRTAAQDLHGLPCRNGV
jgi:O-acetyl-ADP-ribose deacetylase (regulator of RNase III)